MSGFQPKQELGQNTQACADGIKLTIQVTGYGQDQQNQKLYFYKSDLKKPDYDQADEIKTQLAKKNAPEINGIAYDCPCTLFNWDTQKVSGQKLGLQIKKQDGSYLYLHLADNIVAHADDASQQYKSNHILSFIPLTAIDLPRSYSNYLTKPYTQQNMLGHEPTRNQVMRMTTPLYASDVVYAPTRAGYLYVFVNEKLWRELQIEPDDTGKNTYKDIDVSAYRHEDGTFKTAQQSNTQKRKPVGVALDNIWLPYKLSNREINVKIIYSEDQLSPERLNALEKRTSQLAPLKHQPCFRLAQTLVKGNVFGKNTEPFRIDYIPTTRGRNEAIEAKLYYPATYLTDITDKAITKKYQSTKEVDQKCTEPQAPDNNLTLSDFNNLYSGEFREFEVSAWQEILCAKETIWSAHSPQPTKDVLDDYKTRYIPAIPVADPMFELYRRNMLLVTAQNSEIFKALVERTKKIDKNEVGYFITNASYVHADLRNTIKNKLPVQIRHNYNRSIANAERTYILNLIEQLQNEITTLLEDKVTLVAILNLLSNHQDPALYSINLQMIANSLLLISKSPIAYDPTLTTLSAPATRGQVYNYKLANNKKHLLHKALWPSVDFEELTKDAPEQYPDTPNQGDGAFSISTVIAAGNVEKIDVNTYKTIKSELFSIQMQTQYETNLTLLRSELKAGYAGMYGIFCALVSAVEEAAKKRRELDTALTKYNIQKPIDDTQKRKAEQSQAEANKAEKAYEESTYKEQAYAKTQTQLDDLIVLDKTKLSSLGVHEQALLNITPTSFKSGSFLPFIKQMRLIPFFKDLKYILPSDISAKLLAIGFYSQNNLNAFEQLFAEFFGARAANQTLWAKYRELIAKAGIETVNALIDFKDWVLGMKVSAIKTRRKVLALLAKQLDDTFTHLLSSVDNQKLLALSRSEMSANKKIFDALTKIAEQDAVKAAAASKNLDVASQNLSAKSKELAEVPNYSATAEAKKALLKSPLLPGALMMIEAWNILSITKSYNDTKLQRGGLRSGLGVGSATLDGGVAILLYVERLEFQRMQILTVTAEQSTKLSWLRYVGLGKVSLLGFANFASMALTAGICFWDAYYYYNQDNPAWLGYAMTGVGASMLALQALLPTLITPVGWLVVGIGLIVVGIGLATYLDNSDKIKEWFLHGPYRTEVNSTYDYLLQSEEAIYRLLSILLYFQVEIKAIDKQQAEAQWQKYRTAPISETAEEKTLREQKLAQYNKARQANLKVSISCLCANLLTSFQFNVRAARYNARTTIEPQSGVETTNTTLQQVYSLEQMQDMVVFNTTGIDVYLKNTQRDYSSWMAEPVSDKWCVKVQVLARPLDKTIGSELRVFPAPKLESNVSYDPAKDGQPTFKEYDVAMIQTDITSGQAFWFETMA